jgi:hypothetical protein
MENDFERGFIEELQKIAQAVPERTFASEHPLGTPLLGRFYTPLATAPGLEIKGRLAERGALSEAPFVVRHPILYPLLTGAGTGALGALLGAGIGHATGDPNVIGPAALLGGGAGGTLGYIGGAIHGGLTGKEYLEEARRRKRGR